jgi:hypothetical protein
MNPAEANFCPAMDAGGGGGWEVAGKYKYAAPQVKNLSLLTKVTKGL